MGPQLVASLVVVLAVVVVALGSSDAQEAPETSAKGTLFFTATVLDRDSSNLLCGEKTTYELNATPPPAEKAYLNRAVLEALSCDTKWDFPVTRAFTITGDVEVSFPLGCDLIGVIQNVQALNLESVGVSLLKNSAVVVSGQHYVNSLICSATAPYSVGLVLTGVGESGQFAAGDLLTVRVNLRAVNTEPAILKYWYLGTGSANISVQGLNAPPPGTTPSPTTTSPTGTTSTTTPTSSTTTASPGAPTCERDEPPGEDIERTAGEEFTLRGVCTDPDDDLDHADWVVDGETVDEAPLGASPATSEHSFNFSEPGTHEIDLVPHDEEGNEGTPASWSVTVSEDGPSETSPTTSPAIPFFPTATSLALGLIGALGGALLVLFRRT